ncbi:hypothetical protein BJ944DRAFT_249420 [Cunninghamella echinulata]|nr:hypothetical protein BJ944DRAFT_249420 [Cunninghamella echinulata]
MKLSIIISSFILMVNVAIADSLDWREHIPMRVKNQGSCESGYAFAAINALEGALTIKYNRSYDLSEQHLVDCGGSGCDGGRVPVGQCRAQTMSKSGAVTSYKMVSSGDENALMEALKLGPVATAYNADTQEHSYYRSGILDIPNCGNTPTHAATLIGYGNEGGKDYWLLKNSWGANWGEKGYFRLVRGKNMCGIAD